MKRMMTIAVLLLSCLACAARAEGKWTCFSNGNEIRDLAVQGKYLWAATGGGVVRWDTTDGSYVKYTTLDGLAGNDVRTVAVDGRGGVWAGSYVVNDRNPGGLARFDGSSWHSCGGVRLNILCLAIDARGTVWAGGYGGVAKYDGASWTTYTPADGLASFSVRTIIMDTRGNVWAGTFESGVSRFDGVSWTTFAEAGSSIQAGAADADGSVWFATDRSLTHYDGSTWKTYGDTRGFTLQSIYSMRVNARDARWFGARDAARRFYGAAWKEPDDFPCSNIAAILFDQDKTVWFGISDGGLRTFDGSSWKTYCTDATIPANLVNGVAMDSRGALWFSAANGIAKYDGSTWETYHIPDDLTAFHGVSCITTIAVDSRDVIWLGNFADGVIRFDGASWKKYDTADGLISPDVWRVLPDNRENVWAVTFKGISRFDGVSWKTITEEHIEAYASPPLILDPAGHLWAGASRFDGVSWTAFSPAGGLPSIAFTALTMDRTGNVWAGTYRDGISRFNGVSWETFSCWPYPAPPVTSIAGDAAGAIWVGTESRGVARFDGADWKTFTTADGLASDRIGNMIVDSKGAVWICTNAGVMKYEGDPVVSAASPENTPAAFTLCPAHPNPFNSSTVISFSLPQPGRIELAVYSSTAQKIRTLLSGRMQSGTHAAVWDGRDDTGRPVSSGVYLSRLKMGERIAAGRMLLVK